MEIITLALFVVLVIMLNFLVYNELKSRNEDKKLLKAATNYIKNIPTATINKDGSTLYLFLDKNNKFLGQAKTLEDLAKECYNVFGEKFVKVNHSDKDIWFIAGEVIEEEIEFSIEIRDKN